MVKDRLSVSLNLLLNLQNVNSLGELFDFRARNCIDEASFTDTIATDETVLFTAHKFEEGLVEEDLSTDNKSHRWDVDVGAEVVLSIVAHLRSRNLVLVSHKLGNFLVKSISLLRPRLGSDLGELALVELRVVVSLSLFHTNEGVQEIFILESLTVESILTHSHRVSKFLSNDGVSLLNHD
jgi:hypothetical protein